MNTILLMSVKKIAKQILKQILKATNQLLNNPESGQVELNLNKLNQNHRYLVVGNYKIVYRLNSNETIINDIFDTRQNPSKMNDENRKQSF